MHTYLFVSSTLVALLGSSTAWADDASCVGTEPHSARLHLEHEAPLPPLSAYRSPAARVAGISLTTVAAGMFTAGAIVTIHDFARSLDAGTDVDDRGIVALDVGIPMMIASTAFAAAGIPLWVWGAGSPDQQRRASVGVGLGSASFGMSF